MNKNCKRIILKGHSSFAIQGRNLRETAEQFVKEEFNADMIKVTGRISNLKNGDVEIIFCGEDSARNKLLDKLNDWSNSEGDRYSLIKSPEVYDYEVKENEFDHFTIERSDDLSEMVWALRGAGIRFIQSTGALRNINKNIIKRDNKLARGRLFALNYELVRNQDILAMEEPRKNKIYLESIKSNIWSPVIDNESFIHTLYDIFIELQEFKDGELFSEERFDRLKKNITEIIELANKEMESLKKDPE